MKNNLIILSLAIVWLIGGLAFALGLYAIADISLFIPCAALNVITGMILYLASIRNEQMRKVFFRREDEDGSMFIAFLWVFPFILAFLGLAWWLFDLAGIIQMEGNWRPIATLWLFPFLLIPILFVKAAFNALRTTDKST